MDPMLLLIIVLGVLAVILFVVGLLVISRGPRAVVEERLEQYTGAPVAAPVERPQILAEERGFKRVAEDLDRVMSRRGVGGGISVDLARADLKLTVTEFVILNLLSVLGVAVLAALLFRSPIFALPGAVLGFFLPRWWIRLLQRRRLNAFNGQLGDALNLLVNGLRSGYSMLQAMEAVSKELPPPISVEFARVVQEVGLGLSYEDALDNLVRRIRSDDLDLMVTAINVQHEVGGNLAEILDTISYTIRERVRIQGEIRVLTGQTMLSGYIVGFLPIAITVILFLMSRDYIMQMFQTSCGWIMISVAVIIVGAGFFAIKKIVTIDV
jgi:tight adherence protein B